MAGGLLSGGGRVGSTPVECAGTVRYEPEAKPWQQGSRPPWQPATATGPNACGMCVTGLREGGGEAWGLGSKRRVRSQIQNTDSLPKSNLFRIFRNPSHVIPMLFHIIIPLLLIFFARGHKKIFSLEKNGILL